MGRKKKTKEVKAMVEDTVEETIEPEVTEEVVEETIEPEVTEEVAETTGKVVAKKMYLRQGPSKETDPVKILDENTKVLIDLEFNDETFYKVVLDDGTEGYCVKDFIEI